MGCVYPKNKRKNEKKWGPELRILIAKEKMGSIPLIDAPYQNISELCLLLNQLFILLDMTGMHLPLHSIASCQLLVICILYIYYNLQ